MSGDPVFDCQRGNRCIGIFDEQGVMSDTQTEHQIEVGLLLIQKQRLSDRIAHRFGFAAASNRLFVGDSQKVLGDRPVLADNRHHFKAIILQDVDDLLRFLEQSGAEGNSNLMIAAAMQEFDDFNESGVLTIASCLGERRTIGDGFPVRYTAVLPAP